MSWIDTHCHLDAPEFDADRAAVLDRAHAADVHMLVLPGVASGHVDTVVRMARQHELAYALGIHPLWMAQEPADGLARLGASLEQHAHDPRLVAVGEIGLDGFVPGLDMARQEHFYAAQLAIARTLNLPVILHVRRSADLLLKHLRRTRVNGGIAHAFNGSAQQAHAFIDLGFKLGFGGTLTFERSLQIRRLATDLPLDALVLETDAPDIPPHWLYRSAEQRSPAGGSLPQGRNEPGELPRIGTVLAGLRGMSVEDLAQQTARNARLALPRLDALMSQSPPSIGSGLDPRSPKEPASGTIGAR